MPTHDIKKFQFYPFASMPRTNLKERMNDMLSISITSNENDAYEIDTVMPREDKCVHFTNSSVLKSQQITNNNHSPFMQCNNFNICLVTGDAWQQQKKNEEHIHIFWFKRSFFISLLLVFRNIFPKFVSPHSAHISNGALKFCAFTLMMRWISNTKLLISFLFFFVATFVCFVSCWKQFYFRAPELIAVYISKLKRVLFTMWTNTIE